MKILILLLNQQLYNNQKSQDKFKFKFKFIMMYIYIYIQLRTRAKSDNMKPTFTFTSLLFHVVYLYVVCCHCCLSYGHSFSQFDDDDDDDGLPPLQHLSHQNPEAPPILSPLHPFLVEILAPQRGIEWQGSLLSWLRASSIGLQCEHP